MTTNRKEFWLRFYSSGGSMLDVRACSQTLDEFILNLFFQKTLRNEVEHFGLQVLFINKLIRD